ncbi:Ig-like domain-containing protein [Aeribacillus sp. FSL W8-0870]|uniref:Ig-like domain-containing protein n=1 Tax=Aeribacillus sp. FSL W8-0870 TaxID=2954706 RepID=UPI0030CB5C4C
MGWLKKSLCLVLIFLLLVPASGFAQERSSDTASGGNKYILISNESVDVNNTQDTGAFKINNDQYTINKKIGLNAYKLDVIRPFDTEKHEDKKLQQKSLSKKFLNKVGDTKTFWVHDFTTNEDKQISAKLLYSGTKTNVWVYDNQITEADAQKLGQEFDQEIYRLITQNFASESDVDGNGKIHILCYDIQDGFAGFGGYIAGYFYGGDLHDIPYSNKSEIFYIDTYPLMGTGTEKDVSAAYETLAHEFQHMVNFNQNVFIENGSQMDTWLDEALSMAAEHIYTGKPLTNYIYYYNISTSITNGHSLLYWDDNGDTLSNYSLSYLFGQYVRIQANQGNKIFKEILTDTHNDYKAVENVAKNYIDPTLTFGKLMTNFRAALLLKKNTGIYGFNGEEGFDSLIPKIFSGESASLRGGGAIVKRAVGNETVPASKGDDITYTFFDVEENKPSTPPSKPIVNPVSDRDTFINGLSDPGTTVYVQLGSKILNSAAADRNGSFRISISKQKAGTVLSVYAKSQEGNKSESVQITVLDKTPPSIPSVNLVSDKDKTVRGTAEAGSKITIKAGSKVLSTGTTDKNGKFTISLKTAQKAGTVLYVTATDKAGNVSPARKVTVIDKTPPRTPSVNSVSNKDKTVRGTAEAGSKITIKAGSKVLSTGTTDKNGKFAISLKTAQKAGTILYVTATDKAGNVSPARKVTVLDKIPPGAPKVNKVTRKSSSVTGKAEAYSTVYVKAGKKVIGSGKANKNGNFSVSIKKQKAGTVLLVYAKDKVGNVGKSTKVTVKYK